MQRNIKIVVVSTIVGAAMGSLLFAKPTSATAPTAIPPPLEQVQSTYEHEIDQWLDKLATQESGNRSDIVVLDTNNKYSYGCLQFQAATFNGYSRLYKTTGKIMSCPDQRRLAHLMLSEKYGNWAHWRNSTKVIGLPPKKTP